MRDAIGRNVQISLLLELAAIDGGHVSQDSIKMMKGLLPSANIYTWSTKMKRNATPHIGAIHAKCAVADGELAFITSANLTSAAMERNIELGIFIRGGNLPSELHKHLDSLIVAGIFEKTRT
jgi:phosphatidylserine/phosphatidylglycerophosphate/cardiolipin synthase-like enzyme